MELGVDWRKNEPVLVAVGPVLHADDAVANKVCVVRLAEEHDLGFDPSRFAQALKAVDRLPDTLFAPYGLDPQDVSALKAQMHAWAEKIRRD